MNEEYEGPFSKSSHSKTSDRLPSQHLAELIVDAIIDAGLIKKEDADVAVEIATEEIDVRKALGDY